MYTTDTLATSFGEMTILGQESHEGLSAEDDASERSSMTISEAMVTVLRQAMQQGRLKLGVAQCARLLAIGSSRVLMCVLPVLTQEDVAIRIQHMLVESFCLENDIRLVRVKDEDRLKELLEEQCPGCQVTPSDMCCMLVETASEGNSEADAFVSCYHDIVLQRDITHQPIIQLPD